ncbi:MAG TPA: hypothetical protein VFE28_00640 [Candidatus Krumholzibacteria bacterium]|nr:hypothetical protein [Candidatus Krumholzibacteria bacterium]
MSPLMPPEPEQPHAVDEIPLADSGEASGAESGLARLDAVLGRSAAPSRIPSGLLLALAYALGPFAPIVLRQGSRNLPWALLAALSFFTWAGMLWRWHDLEMALETGAVALVPWMIGLLAAAGSWVMAWSRALWLAASDSRFVPARLPQWVREPRRCMLLGFVLPGFGHVVSGHPRRAALVAWSSSFVIVPWLLLWQGSWIWRCNANAGDDAVPGIALEVLFLLAAAFAACGTLIGIAGSLDGARLQALRAGQRTGLHGDRVALALLVTVVLALLLLRPVRLAADLDRFAAPLQHDGYRLVPLCLELGAMGLDRADPSYPMVCAELFDTLGKHERAAALRNDLRRRWESYAEHLLREEVRIGGVLYPPLITITGETEPLPPFLADSTMSARTMRDSTAAVSAPKDSLASALAPGDSASAARGAAEARAAKATSPAPTGALPVSSTTAETAPASAIVTGQSAVSSTTTDSPSPASSTPEGAPGPANPSSSSAAVAPNSEAPLPAPAGMDSTREDTAPRAPRPRKLSGAPPPQKGKAPSAHRASANRG